LIFNRISFEPLFREENLLQFRQRFFVKKNFFNGISKSAMMMLVVLAFKTINFSVKKEIIIAQKISDVT
jgi:hypothetical protein